MNFKSKLQYPLDVEYILRKKKFIKRKLLENENFVEIKIAILGGSTTNEIKNLIEIFLLNTGIKPIFYESEYNKFYEESVFENKDLDQFNPDIAYIHTTNKNISNYPDIIDRDISIDNLINLELEKFQKIWDSLDKYNCDIIQNNFDLLPNRYFGDFDAYSNFGRINFINLLNVEFSKKANAIKNLYLNDIHYLSSLIGIKNWYDKNLWYQAKYALSYSAIPELAFNVSKIVSIIYGKTKKCIVLDLDNTCWGGVIGDDGQAGIDIGPESTIGQAYQEFQKYILDLHKRGITITVCSKNDFNTAKSGFDHPDSILSFSNFSAFEANWNSKDINILKIAKDINLSTNSIVFVDDNPVEREIVSNQIPDVAIVNASQITDFIDHIDRNGFFDILSLSNEDFIRNKFYVDNSKRDTELKKFENYNDFLKSLNMTAEIDTFKDIYLDRINQLINKTNQFNLTTQRYTLSQIKEINKDRNYITLYGKLFDKFGDNGIVSIIIGKIKNDECHIQLFLMSCRVIKRTMEYSMMNEFFNSCRNKGIKKIYGYYVPTKKNKMTENLFKTIGFEFLKKDGNNFVWQKKTNSTHENLSLIKII